LIFKQSEGPGDYAVVVEDDGRVAFAYLLEGREIVGDIWLYNRAEAPETPEWGSRGAAPYLNPKAFVSSDEFQLPHGEADFDFEWFEAEGEPHVHILVRDGAHAAMKPGSKPGWCILAARDGPLARSWAPLAAR